jgi:hypothetical protein
MDKSKSLQKAKNAERKELVKELWETKSPKYLKMLDQFIESHFFDDDKDIRRDAHKLFGKLMDSQVAKKVSIEGGAPAGNGAEMGRRFEEALNAVIHQGGQRVEIQEAEIIDPSEALRIKNISG